MKFVVMLRQLHARCAAHAGDGMPRICAGLRDEESSGFSAADGVFDEPPDLLIAASEADHAMALEDATRVGIDHKDGMITGVKKDGVGCFRADTIEFQQLSTEFLRRLREHAVERAGISCVQKSDEGLEIFCF